MNIEVGQHWPYLYKQAGQTFTIDAEIISVNSSHVIIEFQHPKRRSKQKRELRSVRERARLVDYPVPHPCAPIGSQNAVKSGPKRVRTTISFANERLENASSLLEKSGQPVNAQSLRALTYQAIDDYIGEK
jgi:hypothetical protein